jgi:hypothetical protein
MGRKANSPDGKRAKKRTKAQHGSNGVAQDDNKVASPGEGVTAREGSGANGSKPHRVFVESVPPAMVAEVFEVAGADDDLVLSSVPPPPERLQSRSPRPWSRPPAPHPPHPRRPSAPARALEDADALELASDELEEDTPAATRPRTSGRGAWLMLGVALLLGMALGVRSCIAAPPGALRGEGPNVAR